MRRAFVRRVESLQQNRTFIGTWRRRRAHLHELRERRRTRGVYERPEAVLRRLDDNLVVEAEVRVLGVRPRVLARHELRAPRAVRRAHTSSRPRTRLTSSQTTMARLAAIETC